MGNCINNNNIDDIDYIYPKEYCYKCKINTPINYNHCDDCKKCENKNLIHCYICNKCINYIYHTYCINCDICYTDHRSHIYCKYCKNYVYFYEHNFT